MRAIRLQASSSLNGLAVEQIDLPVPAGAGDALVHVPALQLLVVAFWRKSDNDLGARLGLIASSSDELEKARS
jgi:hypothetical protein